MGGNVAVFEDTSNKVASRLPLFIAVVIGLSVLLLVMAFRSLWIPLVSALFNLLSVAAAYGVVVAVFQEGFGASLIGADSGIPIISFLPVMLFAILFGLSMDYNVFLLSRIHEAYNEGDRPRESVIHGMGRIGKVVVFAGLIMSAVFLSFVTSSDIIGKMFGLGLGLAILIDVLIVRMVIAPAVVTLLGDRAWWLPAWLDRALPNISLDGQRERVEAEAEPGEVPEREKVPVCRVSRTMVGSLELERRGVNRERQRLLIAGVLAAILVGVAILVSQGGGSDDPAASDKPAPSASGSTALRKTGQCSATPRPISRSSSSPIRNARFAPTSPPTPCPR